MLSSASIAPLGRGFHAALDCSKYSQAGFVSVVSNHCNRLLAVCGQRKHRERYWSCSNGMQRRSGSPMRSSGLLSTWASLRFPFPFFHNHSFCIMLLREELFLHLGPHALASRIIIAAFPGAVHTLENTVFFDASAVGSAGVLRVRVRVDDRSPE